MIDLVEMDTGDPEAIVDGVEGQLVGCKGNRPFAVFDVGESFFLCSGEQMAIINDTGGGIVESRIYS
jgi:hypothetical protein